ncbi:hypothetical protein EDEG_01952 [Edhazardia aedis USNM 41457]|uniref:Nucleolar GTP-binding protein 2 n=1 Tax=Edhazardia aedis (strain USNM 41457) TaxID=1003232 RepID=J9DQZ7_EDHAE|nr:hypothetical protein EDEG_01952 [Edhazardia aedis USNM 41457]|eukprot:EJW03757.1 hypothetical protein EDEG_01952 [Edhazardia aedis USNM 41457]
MKENFYHDKAKTKYLNMINSGKAKHDSRGRIIKDAPFQKRTCAPVSKIDPNRKWFCNTKTTTQAELDNFRNQVVTKTPYQVLLSHGNVPYSLLEPLKAKKRQIDDYNTVFGKKATRKKPKLVFSSIEELAKNVKENEDKKDAKVNEQNEEDIEKVTNQYVKGQSRRIWNELYKVIDSSDVIVNVLDARDPLGTRCPSIEKYLQSAKHKHLIYVLNKVDLVPTSVTAKWLRYLSKERPTIAYHSSSLNSFYGRNNLTNLLRQFAALHKEKMEISVGFVGYPNIGKSSIINTLRKKKVCNVAPVPGETKVWQYITLTNRIYLIDCPGIVPITNEKDAVLRGAIRIENVKEPEYYITDIVKRARDTLVSVYGFEFTDTEDFLEKLAVRFGKLLKAGEKDTSSAAKLVLHDWYKGKINWYNLPPEQEQESKISEIRNEV